MSLPHVGSQADDWSHAALLLARGGAKRLVSSRSVKPRVNVTSAGGYIVSRLLRSCRRRRRRRRAGLCILRSFLITCWSCLHGKKILTIILGRGEEKVSPSPHSRLDGSSRDLAKKNFGPGLSKRERKAAEGKPEAAARSLPGMLLLQIGGFVSGF